MILLSVLRLLPTRAFAMGSGGTSLGPGEASSDQLVHHNFKGTWKKGYVDYDSHATGASTSVSTGSSGIRGNDDARMVSDAGVVDVSLSATAGITRDAGDQSVHWCVSPSCCSGTNTAVLATAMVPAEGRNRTGVTALTLVGADKPDKTPAGLQAVWVRVLAKVPKVAPNAPGVSAAALCYSNDADAGGAVYKAGRGALHNNPGGRFKHKTIHLDDPALLEPQEGKGNGQGEHSHLHPLIYITARSDEAAAGSSGSGASSAAFAASVRSSSTSKFEVNAVRLDDKGIGWQHELYVDYLVLPHPGAAPGGGSGGAGPGASAVLQNSAGKVAARYGCVPIGAQSGTTTIWVNFQGSFLPSDTGAGTPTVVLTAQATSTEEDRGRDEVFTTVLGPNSTTLQGFAATIARTDGSAKSSWSQPVQLNWLAFAPA